jgi:hypothetical protein
VEILRTNPDLTRKVAHPDEGGQGLIKELDQVQKTLIRRLS